ncbi:MAG: hypothetical protein ACR5K2_02825 [Wolbachia sp.]
MLLQLSIQVKLNCNKNANNSNPTNKDNSYFQPKAVKIDNVNVIVIAYNLKNQTLVSWYLKSKEGGKFKALRVANVS